MSRERQRDQQWMEPGRAGPRRAIPVRVPAGSLPVHMDGPPATTHQRGRTTPAESESSTPSELEGLYIISVAARLLEMHPQTLRKYERVGLIRPSRTLGMLRLYSQRDIARLRLIKHLVEDLGMNIAGVEFVLSMFNRVRQAQERIAALEEEQRLKELVGQEFRKLVEMLNVAFDGMEQG